MPLLDSLTRTASSGSWLFAQVTSKGWLEILSELETAKLVILLVFGTGFVSAAGYAISNIIRAFHGSPEEVIEMETRLQALEQRIAQLEQEETTTTSPY